MPEIKFETGIVSFKLNDAAEVSFNPTDSAFVEQIFNTFDELDRKQEAYKAEVDYCADKKEIFAIARRRDAEMRDMIDGLFAKPVCADLFGTMNVYALADGLPVWCNLMLAVIDQIDTSFAAEQMETRRKQSPMWETQQKKQGKAWRRLTKSTSFRMIPEAAAAQERVAESDPIR